MTGPTTSRPKLIRSHLRRYHSTVCNCLTHYHRAPIPVTRWIALRPIPVLRRDLLTLVDRHDPWCGPNPAGRRYRGIAVGLPATGGGE